MRRALAVEPRTLRTERLTLRPKRAPAQVPPRPVVPQWGVNPTWAIESHGEEVGRIHLLVRADDQIAEIGYSIVQKHWNQGLATESVRAVIDWAFETLNLVKVYARTEVWNVGSWRVLENVGDDAGSETAQPPDPPWRAHGRDLVWRAARGVGGARTARRASAHSLRPIAGAFGLDVTRGCAPLRNS